MYLISFAITFIFLVGIFSNVLQKYNIIFCREIVLGHMINQQLQKTLDSKIPNQRLKNTKGCSFVLTDHKTYIQAITPSDLQRLDFNLNGKVSNN